jgi:hypothetical protein
VSTLDKKFELTLKGFVFSLSNIIANYLNYPTVGIVLGLIACVFFIKALLIRNEQ